MLELKTVRLAAIRRTDEDLERIRLALDAYKVKMLGGQDCLEEDLLFHLAIASASKNSTINTLMLLITPEIIVAYDQDRVCDGDVALLEVKKHEDIYLAILKTERLSHKKIKVHNLSF